MKFTRTIVCLQALILFAVPAFARPTTEIDMIMPTMVIDQRIAEQLADLVSEESGLKINLVPPPDNSMSVLDALENGYGDIAFALNTAQFRETITTVMPLYPSVLQVLANPDRPANGFREFLSDALVFAGPPGSTSRSLTEQLVEELEFNEGEVTFTDSIESRPQRHHCLCTD